MATRKTGKKNPPTDDGLPAIEGETVVTRVTRTREPVDETGSGNDINLDPVDAILTEQEMSESDALAAAISGLDGGSETKINVYKQAGNGQQRQQWLFSYGAMDMTVEELMEKIQREYGGGDFRIHARRNGGLIFNKLISIAAPISSQQLMPAHHDKSAEIIQQIYAQNNAQMTDLMKALVARPQSDNSGMLKILAPLLAPLLPKIMEMVMSRTDPMAQMTGMLGMLEKLKPLMGEGGAEPEGLLGMAKTFLPMIQGAMEAQRNAQPVSTQNPQQMQAPQVARPAPVAMPAPALQRPAQSDPVLHAPAVHSNDNAGTSMARPDPLAEMRPYLRMLLSGAEREGDPEEFALSFIEVLPADIFDQFAPVMGSDQAYAYLFTIEPKLATHRKWCDDVRTHILANIDVSGGNGESGGRADTDGAHTDSGRNGGSGADSGGDARLGESLAGPIEKSRVGASHSVQGA